MLTLLEIPTQAGERQSSSWVNSQDNEIRNTLHLKHINFYQSIRDFRPVHTRDDNHIIDKTQMLAPDSLGSWWCTILSALVRETT
jgi:hypothetical protein